MTSFNRLYIDGMQQKIQRAVAYNENEITKSSQELELKEMQDKPSISPVS